MTRARLPLHLSRVTPVSVGGGGSSVTDWELIETWGGINDPGSVTTTGTGESSGTLTIVIADGTTAQVDGVQENRAHYRKLITAIWPDFDFTTDILDLRLDVLAYSQTATLHKLGIAFGITEGATIGSRLGSLVGFFPNSITSINTCHLTTTGFNANSSEGNISVVRMRYMPMLARVDGTNVELGSRATLVTSAGDEITSAIVATPSNDLTEAGVANWAIEVGHIKASTTDPGEDITLQFKVYARRFQTSEVLPLS